MMFRNVAKAIEKMDKFGVFFQLSISQNDSTFQSFYGGLASLAIYVTTIGYFLYLLVMWQTRQFPPSVVSQTKEINASYLNITNHVFTLGIHIDKFDDEIHEMVNRTKLYYVEGVFYGWNYSISPLQINKPGYLCDMKRIKQDIYDPICECYDDINQTFLYQDSTRTSDSFWEYQVYYCDSKNDKGCTNKTEQQSIIDHNAFWRLTTYSQDYDFQTGEIRTIPQEYYQPIFSIDDQPLYFQVKVTKGVIYIDEGFIFQSWKSIDIVKDVSTSISTLPREHLLGPQVLVSMEKYQFTYNVRHIKIGQLLADLCSVIQTLLISELVLCVLNRHLLMSKAGDLLMNLYFPDFQDYKIEKDFRDRIISVEKDSQKLPQQQLEEFKNLYSRLKELMERKFSHAQLLQDINRLQIAIQYLLPRIDLQRLNLMDYSLKIPVVEKNYLVQNQSLDAQDFIFIHDRIRSFELRQVTDEVKQVNQLMNTSLRNPIQSQITEKEELQKYGVFFY